MSHDLKHLHVTYRLNNGFYKETHFFFPLSGDQIQMPHIYIYLREVQDHMELLCTAYLQNNIFYYKKEKNKKIRNTLSEEVWATSSISIT